MYTTMVRIRKFEERVADLITAGKILCPCHLYVGQEAVATGVCSALEKTDWVFSTHRSHGHYLAKGGNLNAMMAELFGKDTGCSRGHGGSMHVASPENGLPGSSAIVAGSIALAVGVGLSFSIRKSKSVAVTFFGDGATNEGVFYESINLSVLKKLPVLFVCENNLYSVHLGIGECLSNPLISEVAKAFKVDSVRVDGNNLQSVLDASLRAVEKIRNGGGPCFLECMTYRYLGHVGPTDNTGVGLRSRSEIDSWKARDPILQSGQTIPEAERKRIHDAVDQEIEDAVRFAESSPFPGSQSVHSAVYKGI